MIPKNISSRLPKVNLKLLLNLITFLILGFLIFAARADISRVWQDIKGLNPWILLLAIPIQALNYHSYTRLYQEALGFLGSKIKYTHMYRTAIELNMINTVYPSAGASGFSYMGSRLKDYGVDPSKGVLIQTIRWITIFMAFIVMLFFALILISIKGTASNAIILISSFLFFGIIILILIGYYILENKEKSHKFILFFMRTVDKMAAKLKPSRDHDFFTQERADKLQQFFQRLDSDFQLIKSNFSQIIYISRWALLANITEMATLYIMFVAYGSWVNPGAVIIAYGLATFSGFIAVLPAGAGVYETLMISSMSASGISTGLALSAALTYRIISMIIQLPLGFLLYSRRDKKDPTISEAEYSDQIHRSEENKIISSSHLAKGKLGAASISGSKVFNKFFKSPKTDLDQAQVRSEQINLRHSDAIETNNLIDTPAEVVESEDMIDDEMPSSSFKDFDL